MTSRIPHLLRSTLPRESRRLDLALLRGALVIAGSVSLLPAVFQGSIGAPVGPHVLEAMSGLSLLFLLHLAAQLGGDSFGDVRSGMLGLVLMAGTSPWQWLIVRLVQMWIGFASVWIIRAPMIAFLFTLGGARVETLVATEAAMLLAFFVLSSLALLLSFATESRRQLNGRMVLLFFGWNVLLTAPRLIVAILASILPAPVHEAAEEFSYWLSGFSFQAVAAVVSEPNVNWTAVARVFAVYGGIGVLLLVWFWGRVRWHGTATRDERAGAASGRRHATRRPSRRIWDDALAWHAFAHYSRGPQLIKTKLGGYLLLAVGAVLAVRYGMPMLALISVPMLCGGLLLNAVNKPGECLTREINERTIGTLLLTPHEPRELVAGWKRGALRLAAPDLILWGTLTLFSHRLSHYAPPVMLCIGMVLLASCDFFVLSPLVPFNTHGILSGLAFLLIYAFVAAATIAVGGFIHPYAAPVALLPLLLGFNALLRRSLPYWMNRKLTDLV